MTNKNLILPENQNILAVFAHPDDDVFFWSFGDDNDSLPKRESSF
jgi:hypothetical protein